MRESQLALLRLGAGEAAQAIREGRVASEELVESCLASIEAGESSVEAWAFIDPDHALRQAREADQRRRRGEPVGSLHGVPVAVSDLIDTEDMPTRQGSALRAGRSPRRDARVIACLRAQGGVILGKTATTELGIDVPAATRNPHDPDRIAGTSSAGSAASVAAAMSPFAVCVQRSDSAIRAASYCGVVGYTPTREFASTRGLLCGSPHLDQLAILARSTEDAAMLAEAGMAFDPSDPQTRPRARPQLARALAEPLPFPPRFALVGWQDVHGDARDGILEIEARLGDRIVEVNWPERFAFAGSLHATIVETEVAAGLPPECEQAREQLTAPLREAIERGERRRAIDYVRALSGMERLDAALEEIFQGVHAILAPAAPSDAPIRSVPRTLSTDDAAAGLSAIWALCGLPSITLPLLRSAAELPIGVRLVGARRDDVRLLKCAQWLTEQVARR